MEYVEPRKQFSLSIGERLAGETYVMEREGIKRFKIETRVLSTGEFRLSEGLVVKNKFTRNWIYALDGFLRDTTVSVFDEGGTSRSCEMSAGYLRTTTSGVLEQGTNLFFEFGGGSTAPTVTDNNLVSTLVRIPCQYVDTEEDASGTTLILGNRYALGAAITAWEIGLKHLFTVYSDYATLYSRAVFPSAVSIDAFVERFDVYAIRFPAEYPVYFVRTLSSSMMGHYKRVQVGRLIRAYDGAWGSARAGDTNATGLDIRIGSDNTAPSPTHFRLLSEIGSLSSQTQSVEVDTSLQEVRVYRSGTITPTTSLTFGEAAFLFTAVVFIGSNLTTTTKPIMIARKNVVPAVTLSPGTTYTIGIALVFS